MSLCVIFGGAGFIGTHLAKHFIKSGRFTSVHLADIRESELKGSPGIATSITDVRHPVTLSFAESPEWIFNFAAIHREPGHEAGEYFETNLKGATNVCDFATRTGCKNIYFTSSIAVYGPCLTPTDETKLPNPISPYGGSKYPAELIHRVWLNSEKGRRLIICRPGVVYGPGDPGNILRMIKAIKKGYFAFPGSKKILKSYAYIYGMLESIDFTMNRSEQLLTYNYVEDPTESIEAIAAIAQKKLGTKAPIISVPTSLLLPVASLMQKIGGSKNPIHPVRVKKAGTPTNIVPQTLRNLGFKFNYGFARSLDHWLSISPADFD
jgi:nucleoside-diphosphate-sugar epimerase